MFNREKPQYIEDSKFRYTLREMKKNASVYVLLAPYFLLFTIFTIIPVLLSLPMGFTNFNMVQFPQFVGLSNFYSLILEDEVFLKAIQNTLVFAIITGPLSYIMCFILAWLINEMPRALKTIFTFIFYAPTLAGNIYTTWQLIFSGDTYGIANSYLLDLGIINSARQWLTDANYIMGVVIVVQLWMSLGAGFLALRAGLQGIPKDRYEAGAIGTDLGSPPFHSSYATLVINRRFCSFTSTSFPSAPPSVALTKLAIGRFILYCLSRSLISSP